MQKAQWTWTVVRQSSTNELSKSTLTLATTTGANGNRKKNKSYLTMDAWIKSASKREKQGERKMNKKHERRIIKTFFIKIITFYEVRERESGSKRRSFTLYLYQNVHSARTQQNWLESEQRKKSIQSLNEFWNDVSIKIAFFFFACTRVVLFFS